MFSLSVITQLIGTGLLGLICYYIGQRGWSGVKNDVEDIKTDLSELKAKVNVV